MKMTSKRYGDTVILSPQGRIDHASFEDFKSALAPHLEHCANGQDCVVLDLSAVEYISSVGLRVLMMASKKARAQNGMIVVAALQPIVKEIFEISHFDLVLETFQTVPDAIAKVSPSAAALFNSAGGN
jgi:anti-sigma B factor antagonist/stage II sporulation protein AA (anti-sigma F factor antagonist)